MSESRMTTMEFVVRLSGISVAEDGQRHRHVVEFGYDGMTQPFEKIWLAANGRRDGKIVMPPAGNQDGAAEQLWSDAMQLRRAQNALRLSLGWELLPVECAAPDEPDAEAP